MKLSFSTNGWNFSLKELVKTLADNKIYGLELRDAFNAFGTEKPFSAANIKRTEKLLFENGVSVSCIDSVRNLAKGDKGDADEIKDLIALAKELGCPFVRIHAYPEGDGDYETLNKKVISTVKKVLPVAEDAGVTLLVETMGIYADTVKLADMLGEFACDNLSALWDIHHTVTFAGEKPDITVKNLGKHIKHIHIKDSVKTETGVSFRLLGEGELPLKALFSTLKSVNYEYFISLELNPDTLEGLGDAEIVLPQFVAYMSGAEDEPSWRKGLYYNKTKTGKYIWEKETLIDCTFPQVLDRVVKEFPDQIAFKYTTLDYTRTYAEFRDEVDVVARALMSVGVKAGDHVAVWATNVPEWYLAFWATIKINAVLVTVNTAYKIHEAEYLLKQSDTHTLIMIKGYRDSDYAGIINELCPELKSLKKGESLHCKRLPFLRNVVTVGFEQPGCLTFPELMERSKFVSREELAVLANSVDVHDVCNMQYTSGTTGFPKGVMLTHYNVVNNGMRNARRYHLPVALLLAQTRPSMYKSGTDNLFPRRSHYVYRLALSSRLREDGFFLYENGHNGGQSLSRCRYAGSRGQDEYERDNYRLRSDGSVPRMHDVFHGRQSGSPREYGRQKSAEYRVQDSGSRNQRRTAV